ncbi:MAG: hypothetical protein M5R36_03780 [Deltaproteobacteria bacterium]|nr:hypothetical protein [Deltaproteobacteria bacterium]
MTVLTAAVSGCVDWSQPREDLDVDDIIAIGKGYLLEERGAQASEAFRAAIDLDADSAEARYGLMMAQIMQFTNLIDEFVLLIGQLDLGGTAKNASTTSAETVDLGALIHGFLNDTLVPLLKSNEEQYAILAGQADLQFDLERYILRVNDSPVLDVGGEFDKTDLHFFGAVNAALDGVLEFLLAYNLGFDINALSLPESDPNTDLYTTVSGYLDLVEALLTDPTYPDFLTLVDGGDGHLSASGVALGNVFVRLRRMLDQVATERDPQDDDPVRFLDYNHDGSYDKWSEPIAVGTLFVIDPELASALRVTAPRVAAAFFDGSSADPDPGRASPLTAADLNELLRALDVLPIVLGNPDRPFVIGGLPDFIGLDIGSFFHDADPFALRDFLIQVIDIWDLFGGVIAAS